MRDVSIPVPGGEINVWQRDGHPTVALIPGITSTSRAWARVIEHLPESLGVLAMDVRGRGASWRSPAPYDLRTVSDDLVRALDLVGVGRATVAGHSLGAWVAALFADRQPERVDRVVLVDGALSEEFDPSLDPEESVAAAIGPALARLDLTFPDEPSYHDWWRSHPSFTGRWAAELEAIFSYDLRPSEEGLVARVNREAVIVTGSEVATDGEIAGAWRRLNVPTALVVVDHGMVDQPGGFTPLAAARDAAEANPHIEVTLLEGLNHYTVILGDGAPAVAAIIEGR